MIERQSKKPSGSIISTSPPAGTVVAKGDSISIIESEGITTVTETVQNVVSQNLTDAEATLAAEKLGVKIDQVATAPPNTPAIPNIVLVQSPAAGNEGSIGHHGDPDGAQVRGAVRPRKREWRDPVRRGRGAGHPGIDGVGR